MKLRLDPITVVVVSILLGWGWYEIVDEPICDVKEIHNGKEVLVPYKCVDVLTN